VAVAHVTLHPSGDPGVAQVVAFHNGSRFAVRLESMIDPHTLKRDGIVEPSKMSGIRPGTGDWSMQDAAGDDIGAITARLATTADVHKLKSLARDPSLVGAFGDDGPTGTIDAPLAPGATVQVFLLSGLPGDTTGPASAPTVLEYTYTPTPDQSIIFDAPIMARRAAAAGGRHGAPPR
jgi:hypothetical protein